MKFWCEPGLEPELEPVLEHELESDLNLEPELKLEFLPKVRVRVFRLRTKIAQIFDFENILSNLCNIFWLVGSEVLKLSF